MDSHQPRSALVWIEAVTLIAQGQVAINAWNRIAIPSRYPVKP